ncbi:MAG: cytochrome b5-like heme/steroid binding domain-containing protein [Minisyncoccia bacterium]
MKTTISLLVGTALIIAVGGFVYWQIQTTREQSLQNTTETSGISMADIAAHADDSSCWTAINGNVYDLTSWIPNHPGGEQAIKQLCGTDGSAKFNNMHGGDAKKETVLAGFKIGELAR